MPRPLTASERDILDLLLSADFPGVEELREQVTSAVAEREGMVIDLTVDSGHSLAAVLNRTPVEAAVDGDGYVGGVLLFVDEGQLSGLEYWWVTEKKPDTWPPLSAIKHPRAST